MAPILTMFPRANDKLIVPSLAQWEALDYQPFHSTLGRW